MFLDGNILAGTSNFVSVRGDLLSKGNGIRKCCKGKHHRCRDIRRWCKGRHHSSFRSSIEHRHQLRLQLHAWQWCGGHRDIRKSCMEWCKCKSWGQSRWLQKTKIGIC